MIHRHYHFGYPGLLYILVTLLLAIGAINSQNNLLFLAFAIAIAAGIASGLISGAMMWGATVERTLPPGATAGSPMTIRYTIRNSNRFLPLFAVTVQESDAPSDRRGAAPTWPRHLRPRRGALLHLMPGESAEIPVVFTPYRRGTAEFSGVMLVTAFPFGFVRKSVTCVSRSSIVVAPRTERLRRDSTSNLLSRAESGLTSAPVLGRGDEFYGVRGYVAGDSARFISWRATARTGSLVVREQTAPAAGSLWVVLNFNAPLSTRDYSDDDPTEQAVVLAASLIDAALSAGVEVGLAAPDCGLVMPPGGTQRQRPALMAALAEAGPPTGPGGSRPGSNVPDLAPHRAACIVVHAGGIDPAFGPPGARHLSAADLARLTLSRSAPFVESGLPTSDGGEGR